MLEILKVLFLVNQLQLSPLLLVNVTLTENEMANKQYNNLC